MKYFFSGTRLSRRIPAAGPFYSKTCFPPTFLPIQLERRKRFPSGRIPLPRPSGIRKAAEFRIILPKTADLFNFFPRPSSNRPE
jgi:hypothetical protein